MEEPGSESRASSQRNCEVAERIIEAKEIEKETMKATRRAKSKDDGPLRLSEHRPKLHVLNTAAVALNVVFRALKDGSIGE